MRFNNGIAHSGPPQTRIVQRRLEGGLGGECSGGCGEAIKFRAKIKSYYLIANVYGRDGDPNVWDRREFWHPRCYTKAKKPYGPVMKIKAPRKKKTPTA